MKFQDGSRMDLSCCRVGATAQDLTRRIDAMRAAGLAGEHIYVGKRTGATMDRDGLTALLGFARPGDRIQPLHAGPAGPQHAVPRAAQASREGAIAEQVEQEG